MINKTKNNDVAKKYGCKILEEYCCLVEYELKARNWSKVNEQQTNILLQNMFDNLP